MDEKWKEDRREICCMPSISVLLKRDNSITIVFLWCWVWEVICSLRNLCWCTLHICRKQASVCKVKILYRLPRNTHQNQHHLTGDITQGVVEQTACFPTCLRMNCFIRMANGGNHQAIFGLFIVYADIARSDICE
jgi:hypothetical protein